MSRRSGWSEERRERERERKREREAEKRRLLNPGLPAYVPGINPSRAPRGPSGTFATTPPPNIHEGHELKGQTIRVGPDGEFAGRYDKTRIAAHPVAFEPVPSGHLVAKTTTYLGEDARPRAQYITSRPGEVERWRAFEGAVARIVSGIAPLPATEAQPWRQTDHLGLLPLGDPHLGMLAWREEVDRDFDLAIATRDLDEAAAQLIDSAPQCDRFLIVDLGDFFHAQDDNQRTPMSGNKLDVDTRFAKIFDAGLQTLRRMIDRARAKFRAVRFIAIPGNHDPQMAFMIASVLRAWYRDDPRVEIDPSRQPFGYERFGLNLLGFAHGPSVTRIERLPGVMAHDRAKDWGETEFRTFHFGDIHHKVKLTMKEHPGVTLEAHRTMATQDHWHFRSGYRSAQSLSTIIYHAEFGEIQRNTVSLTQVRASQKDGAAA